MIFKIVLLTLLQTQISEIFFFYPILLRKFFQKKDIFFELLIFSFFSDLILIKPLGFFLFISSLAFLVLSILEKFVDYQFLYQKLLFLFLFNLTFLFFYFYLSSYENFNLVSFLKYFSFNFIFQLIFVII